MPTQLDCFINLSFSFEKLSGTVIAEWKTNRENRLLICKGADICIDLLARIGLHNGI
jgi:hypothetical protein